MLYKLINLWKTKVDIIWSIFIFVIFASIFILLVYVCVEDVRDSRKKAESVRIEHIEFLIESEGWTYGKSAAFLERTDNKSWDLELRGRFFDWKRKSDEIKNTVGK